MLFITLKYLCTKKPSDAYICIMQLQESEILFCNVEDMGSLFSLITALLEKFWRISLYVTDDAAKL